MGDRPPERSTWAGIVPAVPVVVPGAPVPTGWKGTPRSFSGVSGFAPRPRPGGVDGGAAAVDRCGNASPRSVTARTRKSSAPARPDRFVRIVTPFDPLGGSATGDDAP